MSLNRHAACLLLLNGQMKQMEGLFSFSCSLAASILNLCPPFDWVKLKGQGQAKDQTEGSQEAWAKGCVLEKAQPNSA